MAQQLNKMGAKITELPDGMEIIGGTPLVGTEVDSYTDHRIAMSLAIAALNAIGTTTKVLIIICMELSGFEPLTPSMPLRCATNCAITPKS